MRIIFPIIAALIAPLVSAKGTFTLLRSIDRRAASDLSKATFAQANRDDPAAHRMNATFFEVNRRFNPHKLPIIKFVMMESIDDVQKRQLSDLSLIFTTVTGASMTYPCRDPTVLVKVENIQIGSNQVIEKRIVVDSVKTASINTVGARFRVTFKDIFKHEHMDPSNFFVTVTAVGNCLFKFHVELEQPNNFGDAVPLKA
ncbi:hypothetical protein X943_003394 [Babesia divergens]|uniref:Uncharacterized protein n=1 Tax=Babesia divergens TaxID=32595 RepID=A0AAD9GHT3_BABDI|nr:hypothetical protein X943_003394 [Babesia divergens]